HHTEQQAIGGDWATEAALDVMATAAVPVAHPIANARQRTALRVRVSGVALDRIPSDEEQVRRDSVLSISRPQVASLPSYPLPYGGAEHAGDLAATAFLQTQHPRVQAAAHAALGEERDARAAAIRLND